MVHNQLRHPRRPLVPRNDGIPVAPTAAGLTGAASVAAATDATAPTLAINTAAAGTGAAIDQGIQFSSSATNTVSSSVPTGSDTSNIASSSPSPQSTASGSTISMGTVIGACLGAFAGAVFLILIGLWLYKRGTKPRPRSPSNARTKMVDKERAWGKIEDDHEDKWEGKDGSGKYQQKGVVSVGPMEKLTMFKKSTPSMHTTSHSGDHSVTETEQLPTVAPFAHPFAQYHPNLAKDFAEADGGALVAPRPFLARVETVAPISWDGDTIGRDSFLSLGSNNAGSPMDMAIPTPKLTSSEPHHWESAEVMHFDPATEDGPPRGRSPANDDAGIRRKSAHNPFFGASARGSVHSTHSTRSRSQSRSRTPSISGATIRGVETMEVPDMPAPPASAYTREEKGKYRAATPPSPASSRAPSTILAHDPTTTTHSHLNPFSDPVDPILIPTPTISFDFKGAAAQQHASQDSQDRALASLLAALGPDANATDVQERLRVASMNPSLMSSVSAYTETDGDTLHQSWPVPPSRP